MITSKKLYDGTKWAAQIFLPALGAFIFALSGVWGFDTTGKIVGTITAVDAFLGLLLKKSNDKYVEDLATLHQADLQNLDKVEGDLYIAPVPGADPELTAAWDVHPDDFKDKETVTLRVKNVSEERLKRRPANPQEKK